MDVIHAQNDLVEAPTSCSVFRDAAYYLVPATLTASEAYRSARNARYPAAPRRSATLPSTSSVNSSSRFDQAIM